MEEENSATVKDDQGQGEVPVKKIRRRKKQLYEAIRKQMEFYFSDANLTKDRFLGKLIAEDPCIDISVFLQFNKIRALTTDMKDVCGALRNSELLSVTEDGTKVFRTTPVKEKNNTDDCTIYVEQLPLDAQHEWLRDVFSAYGKVAYVSLPKYRTSGKIKGFAFVEFETPEEANKTLEAFGARGCCLSSQIAPEKLCSISTYEPDEVKSENVPSESDKKDASEKISDNEESQFQDKLSRKKKKRKKEKQEHGMELNIEGSEVFPAEKGKEGDMSVKKCKRKRIQGTEMDGVETNVETGHSQPEDDSPPLKKKKRKRTEESGVEETEGNTDTVHKDTSIVLQSYESETCLEKKKRKRKNVEAEETVVSEHQQVSSDVERENEGVVKRKKMKSEEWDEEVVDEVGTEVGAAEEGVEDVVKKKTRKRKKKHMKDKQDIEASRLQILSKREWKRLRNKYLDLQKQKMKCFKQYLGRNRWNSNPQFHHHDRLQHANGQNQEEEEEYHGNGITEMEASVKQETEKKPRFAFTPGVIVHAVLDEPVVELRKFKVDAKALGDVEYVDVVMGSSEAFLRCSTPAAAQQLVSSTPWQQVEILKGDAESQYWNKMISDREQKFANNIRSKQRGRDKILRRAERELGKHIRFDE